MNHADENRGLLLGVLGVLGYSLTPPMTRLAVAELDPVTAGLGRSVLSAVLAIVVLAVQRDRWPARRHLPGLLVVALGSIIGFPLFLSLALQHVPAAHSAVVIGLLPLVTALCGTLFDHDRPSRRFWLAAIAGSACVIGFVFAESGWDLRAADGFLLLSVLAGAIGYAEGGRLSRELEGRRVISWALVLSLPLLIGPVIWAVSRHGLHASPRAWGAFAYTGIVSMFLATWVWYAGLARGGVARVSQVQLLQPFLTIAASWWLLGERITTLTWICAVVVLATVMLGRGTAIHRRSAKA
jgi:drug/metabolite transporter (DMT)-like permease